ncbi:histidine phosphatase family protein [Streptomyces sp. NBC_00102]|uniref:histidine phosphatase family protein n=1 Tax=Streptomyces sp. NBC_00102 TaxID=2975652 RepID=UPI00224DFB6A|nr:histidine phosphatase family protein [Streptomyces sp. NBC_00102]MCX5402066.1 histidine phosphatase family protein [Streptomyces sp. NBC_00102]
MTLRVTFVSPALNPALREARFAGDGEGPIDDAGERRARAAASAVPCAGLHLSGPSERCLCTARALGLPVTAEPRLRDWEMGRWRGRRLSDVAAAEPDGIADWLGDPAATPHGGESMLALIGRVGGWLDSLTGVVGAGEAGGRMIAVAEPSVVRAAVVHAVRLPPEAFWRLDVAPLSFTTLTGRSGRWNLSLGAMPPGHGEPSA